MRDASIITAFTSGGVTYAGGHSFTVAAFMLGHLFFLLIALCNREFSTHIRACIGIDGLIHSIRP